MHGCERSSGSSSKLALRPGERLVSSTWHTAQVYKLNMHMADFGHDCLKPTTLVSNWDGLGLFKGKEKQRPEPQRKVATAVKYWNRKGKLCYKASPQLKSTQRLSYNCMATSNVHAVVTLVVWLRTLG